MNSQINQPNVREKEHLPSSQNALGWNHELTLPSDEIHQVKQNDALFLCLSGCKQSQIYQTKNGLSVLMIAKVEFFHFEDEISLY